MSDYYTKDEIVNIIKELLLVKSRPCHACEGRGTITFGNYSYPCSSIGCVNGNIFTYPPLLTEERLNEVLVKYNVRQQEIAPKINPEKRKSVYD